MLMHFFLNYFVCQYSSFENPFCEHCHCIDCDLTFFSKRERKRLKRKKPTNNSGFIFWYHSKFGLSHFYD